MVFRLKLYEYIYSYIYWRSTVQTQNPKGPTRAGQQRSKPAKFDARSTLIIHSRLFALGREHHLPGLDSTSERRDPVEGEPRVKRLFEGGLVAWLGNLLVTDPGDDLCELLILELGVIVYQPIVALEELIVQINLIRGRWGAWARRYGGGTPRERGSHA